jgi:hypothetical protein
MDMNAVASFQKHYQTKSQISPDLYRSGDRWVDVILPNDLLEYANAASGHSGFGSGARARGIRRECRNSSQYLAEIFASPEALAGFLNSSEKNAEAYIETVRERHLASTQQPVKASELFWKTYTKEDMAALRSRVKDSKALVQDYQTMTMTDFALKYDL